MIRRPPRSTRTDTSFPTRRSSDLFAHSRTPRRFSDDDVNFLLAVANTAAAKIASLARSEEHTSELQSLMRISYAVFCLNKKKSQASKTPKKKPIPYHFITL